LVHDLGITVILAEHRMERVAGFVDLGLACLSGRVVLGDPARVLELTAVGPPVARLGRELGWSPAPLTVRDARRAAKELSLSAPEETAPVIRGEPLVEVRGLNAGYRDSDVLRKIDLDIAAGEIVAVVGRNGAGKTTLLRCIAGLHPPSKGSVMVAGHPPRPGVDVALCPQTPEGVLFRDSVEDEVTTTLGWSDSQVSPGHYLEGLGLQELATRHPRDLSAGERLLVATAAMAATGAPVLLLDEPTRGLDLASKARLTRFLRAFVSEGNAVALASHDVELVAELAGRVVMLAGGEVIDAGSPTSVLGDSPVFAPQMARVFGPRWMTPEQVVAAVRNGAQSGAVPA
jgi:energy-coupling factor transport system ATP-binding protein